VLAHSDLHFLNRVARLQADSPFAICHVGFEALIWSPLRGMNLSAYDPPPYQNFYRAFSLVCPHTHTLHNTDKWQMKLVGRVTLCSPDHVSLLVHRIFNVSIPRHHIPTDRWEFEYGPAENDPEFGNADDDDAFDADITADATQEGDDPQVTATDQRGRWVHKVTGDRLGGKDRWLEFTVVGYAFSSS
jgi:DNA-directed RNA polymerase I subunit RPA43